MTKQKKIDCQKLHTGLFYQEVPNPERVSQIVSDFDWNLFDPLAVSFRDGQYNVVEGQHRLYAIKQKYGQDTNISLPCCVREDLTEEEEMELFININTKKRKIGRMELYKAKYGAKNKQVVTMVNTLIEQGFICDFKNSKSTNRIVAIDTMFYVYNKLQLEEFKEYLYILKETWNGKIKSLSVPILKGLYEFYVLYKNEYDKKIFIKNLSKVSPEDIILEGKKYRGYTGYTVEIFRRYNKNLKKNSLKEKFNV